MNKNLRLIVFFLFFFSVFGGINYYVIIRGRQAIPEEFFPDYLFFPLLIFLSLAFVFSVMFEKIIHYKILAFMELLGGTWMIYLLYFFVMAIFGDLFRLLDYFFAVFPDSFYENYDLVKLAYLLTLILLLIVFSIIGNRKFRKTEIVHKKISIDSKKSTLNKIRIVAVSDVHLGDLINVRSLRRFVEQINNLNADIILIAGDLFDRNLQSVERQGMTDVLKTLEAKNGVYGILGNHEYIGNVNKAVELIEKAGIKLLRDSYFEIEGTICIVGRDDFTNKKRKTIKLILENSNNELPKILLDHQPVNLSEAVENQIDLQISGHTHNGQIYPINHIVSLIYKLGYGYKKIGNTHFYVSSGLGIWGAPIRIGTQSEIVCFDLELK
ncbi:MAG: metallophosphoesterase [Bacteroidales bacterium]|nr:metallophosphoesterase [Bacteroidales bacterium]